MADALAIDGNARARDGIAVVGSTACPCCGGCAEWRRFAQCPTGPLACTGEPPPPQQYLWICRSVTCLGGQQITEGTTVYVGGLCWTAEDVFANTLPPGSQFRASLEPVECTTGCNDPRCPQGELWYISRPCTPGVDPVAVCGVTVCEVRGCHVVDPATGGMPFDQIPPGIATTTLFDLGPPRPNCCACGPNGEPAGGCLNLPVSESPPPQECVPNLTNETCCCTIVDGQPVTTYRITRCITTQTISRPALPNDPAFNNTAIIELLDDCTTVARYTFIPISGPVQSDTGFGNIPSACYRRCPGGWPLRALRLTTINGSWRLIGFEGNQWGIDCNYENDPSNPEVERSVITYSSTHRCYEFRQTAEYQYIDRSFPDDIRIFTTRFEWTSVVEGGTETCNQPCGDDIVKPPSTVEFDPDDIRNLIA